MSSFSRSPLIAKDTLELRAGLVKLVPELRGRALRLARNNATAEDLVQDTIVRALTFAPQYERGTNLRAWVYQILFSVFVTRYRRSRRERVAVRLLATDPCAWTRPEARGTWAGLTRCTRTKLDALPEGFREAVQLVDLEDCSYRDAAGVLKVPIGTVMSRLHRGRKLLAASLREAA